MNSKILRILLNVIPFVIGLTTVLFTCYTLYQGKANQNTFNIKDITIAVVFISTIVFSALSIFLNRKLSDALPYKPYNVAIIGYPKSGKTTLIVTLFQEIFAKKIRDIKATLKGESTIDRVNSQMEQKEKGIPLGPTTDQTMFSYRTNITYGKKWFLKEYRVEFGDFMGEYSESLANENYFNDLKKTDFFKWSVQADAYIFMIDVGRYLIDEDKREFIASTSKIIRQSWQHFVDYDISISPKSKKKPILLIFNKMDLCDLSSFENKDEIERFSFSTKKAPPITDLSLTSYNNLGELLKQDFNDLIAYLKSETQQFNILFTSSFGKINGHYADVDKILRFVLPQETLF